MTVIRYSKLNLVNVTGILQRYNNAPGLLAIVLGGGGVAR